jgi:hypothetical protein
MLLIADSVSLWQVENPPYLWIVGVLLYDRGMETIKIGSNKMQSENRRELENIKEKCLNYT